MKLQVLGESHMVELSLCMRELFAKHMEKLINSKHKGKWFYSLKIRARHNGQFQCKIPPFKGIHLPLIFAEGTAVSINLSRC